MNYFVCINRHKIISFKQNAFDQLTMTPEQATIFTAVVNGNFSQIQTCVRSGFDINAKCFHRSEWDELFEEGEGPDTESIVEVFLHMTPLNLMNIFHFFLLSGANIDEIDSYRMVGLMETFISGEISETLYKVMKEIIARRTIPFDRLFYTLLFQYIRYREYRILSSTNVRFDEWYSNNFDEAILPGIGATDAVVQQKLDQIQYDATTLREMPRNSLTMVYSLVHDLVRRGLH